MDSATHAVVALSALPISGRHWDAIMSYGGAESVWQGGQTVWTSMLGRNGQRMSTDMAHAAADQARYFVQSGGAIIGTGGPHELGRLLNAPSPPLCAYLRGNRHLLPRRPSVAIIGTREPSDRGRKRAHEIAAQLSAAGCLIISGGANGIDMAAHEGAASASGETLAVLGNPVHVSRDERPGRLRELGEGVTTLTVFGPWVKTNKMLFVVRNQYVAALADALVVIEGKLDSGTLHTARYAKQMNVPVWAVPGDPDNPLAGAANLLLSEGTARALVASTVLIDYLNLTPNPSPDRRGELDLLPLSYGERGVGGEVDSPIVALLRRHSGRLTFDLLCDALGQPVAELQKNLLELQMMGTIRKEGTELVLK